MVADLERRGAVFVEDESEVPEGSLVVFSAHGVAPAARTNARARGLEVVDATCPLVTKVHREARRFAAGDRTILLIGHAGHDEVAGTTGHAPGHTILIETVGDAETVVVPNPSRVAYLSQTTLSVDETAEIVAVLRGRFPGIEGPPSEDICYATQNRQQAIKEIAARCELVLVIGSVNSSNSNRLVEVARSCGTASRLVEDDTAIDPGWLDGVRTVGVTAGASAPEHLVDRVVAALRRIGGDPADVEEVRVAEEHLTFGLPVAARAAAVSDAVAQPAPSGAGARVSASSSASPSSGPTAMSRSPASNSNLGRGR